MNEFMQVHQVFDQEKNTKSVFDVKKEDLDRIQAKVIFALMGIVPALELFKFIDFIVKNTQ